MVMLKEFRTIYTGNWYPKEYGKDITVFKIDIDPNTLKGAMLIRFSDNTIHVISTEDAHVVISDSEPTNLDDFEHALLYGGREVPKGILDTPELRKTAWSENCKMPFEWPGIRKDNKNE